MAIVNSIAFIQYLHSSIDRIHLANICIQIDMDHSDMVLYYDRHDDKAISLVKLVYINRVFYMWI